MTLTAALEMFDAGLMVIPVSLDGSKSPATRTWRQYIKARPEREKIERLFREPAGIAILGGPSSGGLEIIDFDRADAFPEWCELVEECQPGQLAALPIVKSPNGYHVYYRHGGEQEGNQKLAMYPNPNYDAKDPKKGPKNNTKVETRGNGGYVIAPPSPAAVHPSGKLYEYHAGPPLTKVPTITAEFRAILLDCARSLNEVAESVDAQSKEQHTTTPGGVGRPGDDFEGRASWDEIMRPAGWTPVRSRGDITHWRRPGKDDKGISATTGVPGVGGKLYVFSSNAAPFQSQRAYGKFSAYAWLHHGGDFANAARELRAKGFGAPREQRQAPPPTQGFKDLGERFDSPPPDDTPMPRDDDAPDEISKAVKPITNEELDRLLDDDKGAALCEPTFSRLMATRDDEAEWQRIEFVLRRHKAAKLLTEKIKKHDKSRARRKDSSWKERLLYRENKSGDLVLENCLTNHVTILAHDAAWDGVLAFDEFANKIVTKRSPPFKRQAGEWGDADALETKTWIEQAYGLRPTTPAICEAILMVAKRHAFNALRDYLDSLEDPGGESALDTWLIDFFGAPDTEYTRTVGAKWLIAAVARAYEPGCKVDTVLILEGKQGFKKSRVLEQLCPRLDWFTDGLSDFGSKAQAEEVEGKWIVELGELKGFGKELEQIKAFVTRRAENYRPAYARYSVHSPRKCVFAGTVNPTSVGYFRDETGNRRYWPVECTKQAPELTPAMRDRLWAEAKTRYKAKESWWLDDDRIMAAATAEQEKRVYLDPWHEAIERELVGKVSTSVDEVLTALRLEKSKWGMSEAMRVGRVLTALKWIRYQDRVNGQRTWRYKNPAYASQPQLPTLEDTHAA
jgi:predicted P-loop ATPase